MIRLLSFALSPDTPTYPGTSQPEFTPQARTERGDVSNWLSFTTHNHASTHVDGPWHFNPNGKRITDIDPKEFFFATPRLIDVPKGDDELVTWADLEAHANEIRGCDLLLIRTGYGASWRERDPKRYSEHSPGFHSSAGRYLIRSQPSIRAVGMDFISATCQRYIDEGMEFHRIVLGREPDDRYIFLIEDARIDVDLLQSDLGRVIMAPLLLEDQDGGQVTMLAEPASQF